MTEVAFTEVVPRRALPNASTGFVLLMEFVATIAASVFFGLDYWVPTLFLILGWWLLVQFESPALALIACNSCLGLAFSEELFGFPEWPSGMIGAVAAAFLALGFASGGKTAGGDSQSGDANPVPYIVAIIATRAFLALKYAQVAPVGQSTNILNWIGLFVFGAVPGAPVIVNVLFVMALQGTLLIYLILVLKRIASPFAN